MLTQDQDLPLRSKEKSEKWTSQKIFPFTAMASAISKNFTNPFDIMLSFVLFGIVVAELMGRHPSWMIYMIASLLIFADLGIHMEKLISDKKDGKL